MRPVVSVFRPVSIDHPLDVPNLAREVWNFCRFNQELDTNLEPSRKRFYWTSLKRE